MIYFYKLLFFSVYSLIERLNNKMNLNEKIIAFRSVLLISFFLVFDVDFILRNVLKLSYARPFFYTIIVLIFGLNFYLFYKVIDYKTIINEFSGLSKEKIRFSLVLTLLFFLISIIAAFN